MAVEVTGTWGASVDFDAKSEYGDDDNYTKHKTAFDKVVEIAAATCDRLYEEKMNLATGANSEVDMQTDTDMFGNTLSLVKVMAIWILVVPQGSGVSGIVFSPGASNGWWACFMDSSDKLTIPPNVPVPIPCPAAGHAVDATHKTLKFLHDATDGTDVDVYIAIAGNTS